MPATLHVFTKPDCSHCNRAKAVLNELGYAYTEHDVTADAATAARAIHLSGQATVPQIFVGTAHIAGADDLVRLQQSNRLVALIDAAQGDSDPEAIPPEVALIGAEDVLVSEVIPPSDGTKSEDPEDWPLLRFYKDFFGFWPNCFAYMHHWPEAYRLFVYAHNWGAIGMGREVLGPPIMMATGFSTSNAAGCDYCQVHMTAAAGDMSAGMPQLIAAARAGNAPENSPIGPFELELVELAAEAARNSVTSERLERIRALSKKARASSENAQANIEGTALIASAFGFLNTFNDLSGVDVEPDWADHSLKKAGIGTGRHKVGSSSVASNLGHDLPQGGPTIEDIIARIDATVSDAGGVEAYCAQHLGMVPPWIAVWPEPLRARQAVFYAELMQSRAHSALSAELKHLIARVSAITRGHATLAAVEAMLAVGAAANPRPAIERVRTCYAAATGRAEGQISFTPKEQAALRVAWLSAHSPLTTPRTFIAPAIEKLSAVELVHVFVVCGLAGLVQRFSAIMQPALSTEVIEFCQRNGIETDCLSIRYPLS